MEIFKNILIALELKTDEEQAEIDHALTIAQAHKATAFTLFTVIPELTYNPEKMVIPVEKKQELSVQRAYEKLERIADYFPKDNSEHNTVTCRVKVGDPAIEIVKQVLKESHDLLLMSTKKQKTVKEHLLGSTTVEIMRQCPCPIWAVKPDTKEERKMMIGLHFDEKIADHNDTLNHQLLDIATAITEKPTAEIHLVNVVDKLTDELSQQRLSEINNLSKDNVNTSFEIIPVILEGDVTTVLPAYAEKQSIDLLIMGMLSRTGLRGFFIGNTSEKIMDDINCSVLVVKPKEFVSQIRTDI